MKNLLFHLKAVKTGTHKAQVGAGARAGAGAGAETFVNKRRNLQQKIINKNY